MKKHLIFAALISALCFSSCSKEDKDLWKVEITKPADKVVITDISKELYDPNVTLEQFKAKYPWFQGTVSDEEFEKRRKDAVEIGYYKDAMAKIDIAKLEKGLQDMFSHIQFYYPEFKQPTVFLFSSALQMAQDPIFHQTEQNMLFIDVTGFMGTKSIHYKGLEAYFRNSMNPENIIPKVATIFAEQAVPPNMSHQRFLDQIILNGKIMILKDAFLPDTEERLKMNYSKEQMDWANQNEANVWTYFVEHNSVFSDDPRLPSRFIEPGPFSKFYTEIDNQSSPQIGIYSGWKICQTFLKENPDVKLVDFLKMDAEEIFNRSSYKPKVD